MANGEGPWQRLTSWSEPVSKWMSELVGSTCVQAVGPGTEREGQASEQLRHHQTWLTGKSDILETSYSYRSTGEVRGRAGYLDERERGS